LNTSEGGKAELDSVSLTDGSVVQMLGVETQLKWQKGTKGTVIEFPTLAPNKLPSHYAWVLKITQK
jgi:hypothetical protein